MPPSKEKDRIDKIELSLTEIFNRLLVTEKESHAVKDIKSQCDTIESKMDRIKDDVIKTTEKLKYTENNLIVLKGETMKDVDGAHDNIRKFNSECENKRREISDNLEKTIILNTKDWIDGKISQIKTGIYSAIDELREQVKNDIAIAKKEAIKEATANIKIWVFSGILGSAGATYLITALVKGAVK